MKLVAAFILGIFLGGYLATAFPGALQNEVAPLGTLFRR
jgi:hypothetical protein